MQTNIQDIYQQSIFPLPDAEQLKLATLILENMTKGGSNQSRKRGTTSIRNLFGKGQSGNPSGADNEKIDADLRREYLDAHEE
ncbi:MAG: hypothetical protein KBD94_11650 [Pyrinomonadaceae bacterium]|nr:hypothetical protein [Pyrinomonadaceae bacterium]